MTLLNVEEILKGGKGSGDWGHTGRAGKRGGSGGGGGKGKPRKGRRSREVLDKEIEARKKPKRVKEKGVFIAGDPISFNLPSAKGTGTYAGQSNIYDDLADVVSNDGTQMLLRKADIDHIGGSKKKDVPKSQTGEKKEVDKKPKVTPDMELPNGMILGRKAPTLSNNRGVHYFITKDGFVMDLTNSTGNLRTHPGIIMENKDNKNFSAALGLSDNDIKKINTAAGQENGMVVMKTAIDGGTIRVRQSSDGAVIIQTDKIDKRTLRKLQRLYDKGALNFKPNTRNFWENGDMLSSASFSFADFLDAKFVIGSGPNLSLKELKTERIILKDVIDCISHMSR